MREPPLSAPDFAYIAGIIDGEGTILWHLDNIFLRATNTHEDLVAWLALVCGGSKNVEGVYGEKRRVENARRSKKWRWTVTGYRAAIILAAIRPYLIVKAERADEILERWKGTEPRRLVGPIRKAEIAMMALGWPLPAAAGKSRSNG